ncbi:MAG: DUF2949 domain-containing protein [Leptolyngbyaceae cyanobacterium CSU_1_3]|jgi:Protein of unknown function (DUF2949)|nr:DUF2949 domain-containing protein [Leptolyngbyaceae cyanobacterium CSU_1_3]
MVVLPKEVIKRYELEDFVVNLDRSNTQLIRFLQDELAISPPSIAMALRCSQQERGPLPMILWRYGFVSLDQLNQILDWMEK